MTVPSPSTVRLAALLVGLEGVSGLVAAVAYVVSGLSGNDQPGMNFFGTAAWFAIIGGGVAAAGWALWSGRRWGRGIAVFAQLLLLPVAWYMGVGSHQWVYGGIVAVVALATLGLLFSPSTLQWLAVQDAGQSSAAKADNSGPDTR
ncbi:hypothetical protein H7I53_02890 [Mycolicibacterium pulveris]|uniref:Integral membrane protein n=1 Tax=Mycolicibacterium pulveris TaxID=36813 RepID=A0A7I7UHG0_MYCPV|nr:hypothetical protein [Mycolicibacterium pulveris]MCV6979174.1 hypothetical protein [Mycolicibacterium pulveris]BBY79616.1 hypothetical protein MPUL_07740 [Mycolicibacterium pulveris]